MIRDRILDIVDLSRPGLEIGALDKPTITRAMGPVGYVDRGTREQIVEAYGGHGVDIDAIVDVDHVWGDQTLFEAVGGQRRFAYVVTSHVIEHVPDLLGWLMEIAAVLEDGGHAVFIVPDKRYTFDIQRRTSSPAEFVDAHVRGLRRPDARQLFDHLYNVRDLTTEYVGLTDAQQRDLLGFCRAVHVTPDYHDVHCWVFTPHSLLETLDLASRLDLLPFEIERLEPTAEGSHEFLAVLRRLPEGLDLDQRRAAFVASRDRVVLPDETEPHSQRPTLAELEAARLRDELASARLHSDAVAASLAAIKRSTSWRLTAPLRGALDAVRGLTGRRGAGQEPRQN